MRRIFNKRSTYSIYYVMMISVICFGAVCQASETEQDAYVIESYGSRLSLIHEGKLDSTVNLKELDISDIYAIGPVEGLQGEVTVYGGNISISTVINGAPSVSANQDTGAIFLITAKHNDWLTHSVARELSGLNEVESYIKGLLEANNIDLTQPRAFRIETSVPYMKYHIIFKTNNTPHDMAEHRKAKIKFELADTEVDIVGFWVDEHRVGKFTHPGKRTHMHFIAKDQSTSGHIDNIVVPIGAQIFIGQ
ncbi:acetolactate decarboxylase [Glaciecola siphonariae]|uniref:Acetolactate decarboxylase n=1 Tax=Glaciecola siphonariae TaxID=521012 RepID=A0ABV9LT15_9ALTE